MLKKTNPLYIPREPRIATVCVTIKKLFCGKQTIRHLYLLKYCIYMYISWNTAAVSGDEEMLYINRICLRWSSGVDVDVE